MYLELKENQPHGTSEFPYTQYFIHDVNTAFQSPVHWHNEFEIIYITKGMLHVNINGQNYTGSPGCIFLANPKDLHFMGTTDTTVEYYTILFPLEFISFQSADLLEHTLLKPLRNGQKRFVSALPMSDELTNILDQLIHIKKEDHPFPYHQIKTRVFLLEFFYKLLEMPEMIYFNSGNPTNQQREILTYIQQYYTDKITLADLAEHFHLSEKYLSRYFKKHFYISFSQYLSHLRLAHAKNLLETSDLSITEVAASAGFPSVSFFIRSFKSSYGITPLQYRKTAPKQHLGSIPIPDLLSRLT